MSSDKSIVAKIKSYIVGYILSIIATLIPFYLVITKSIEGKLGTTIIFVFAFLQFLIQLIFFMHAMDEEKPRWRSVFMAYTIFASVLFVGLSWWIMSSLDHFAMMM